MDRLIEFLRHNPILVFILLAWIAGMVGNVVKAARKAKARGAAPGRVPPAARPARAPQPAQRNADDIAAEMRRILGMEPEAPARPAPRPRVQPTPQPTRQPPPQRPRLAELERPPTPVAPTTQQRHLEIHVDPHVGEALAQRRSEPVTRTSGRRLGSLGGRVQEVRPVRENVHRFPLDDLKTAFVLSEILGPPVGLRPSGSAHPR